MTEINIELLEQTMAFIEANPERHYQGDWFTKLGTACGTSYCFAGHAAILAGAEEPKKLYAQSWGITEDGRSVAIVGLGGSGSKVLHVREWAMDKLGLTSYQASNMFYAENTIEALRAMVERLKADPTDGLLDLVTTRED